MQSDTESTHSGQSDTRMSGSGTRLIHFKLAFAGEVNINAFCIEAFYPHRYLSVLEKVGTNPHIHVQGTTDYSATRIKQLQDKHITSVHPFKKLAFKRHIIRNCKKDVTEKGFQYLCKQPEPSIVCSYGFTPEEIAELHALSNTHVAELKTKYAEPLDMVTPCLPPEVYHHKLIRAAGLYYAEAEKQRPPQLKQLIINYMSIKSQKHKDEPWSGPVFDYTLRTLEL